MADLGTDSPNQLHTNQTWRLVYTKPRAESWAEVNLRRQGFELLLPRVRARSGFVPLFPRYVFVAHGGGEIPRALNNTRGVLYLVRAGDAAVRVPDDVIAEVRSRMDAHGVVTLEPSRKRNPLFDIRERERLRALVKLAAAGFRVRVA